MWLAELRVGYPGAGGRYVSSTNKGVRIVSLYQQSQSTIYTYNYFVVSDKRTLDYLLVVLVVEVVLVVVLVEVVLPSVYLQAHLPFKKWQMEMET